jgi:hypothetical protein
VRRHLDTYRTTPGGLLFRGTRGGILSESVYGRAWHAACDAALGPDLAVTPLARRPYDLRHAALSLWLNATADPARVAARAGNSVSVLHEVYTHCISGHDDSANQQVERALSAPGQLHQRKASGAPHRRHPLIPVRYMSVNGPHPAARTAARRAPSASHQNAPGRVPAAQHV